MTVASICLVILGIAMAVAHLLLLVPATFRPEGATRAEGGSEPELFRWGYIGVGLLTSAVAYGVGRLLGGGRLTPEDAVGLVLLLAVASWGFGAGHERLQSPGRRDLPSYAPLVASLLLGLTLGLSSFQP